MSVEICYNKKKYLYVKNIFSSKYELDKDVCAEI